MGSSSLSEREIQAAVDVLRSGNLRQGRRCQEFEQKFAEFVGSTHAVACASGTAALHLSYLSTLQPGDEVLIPSLSFVATASMAAAAGLTPVFCDVDPDTFLLDLTDAARRLTPRTRAIVPVHLFGNPCVIDDVGEFARKHRLKVIWDAAQAHGARYNGQDVGACGDVVCYSLYASKNLFVGEGGMICTNDQALAEQLAVLRDHGQWGKYQVTHIGFNYRMTEIAGAIGCVQLERLDAMLSRRSRNARLLRDGLNGVDGLISQRVTPNAEHAWHQFSVVVDNSRFGIGRDELAELLHGCGVASSVHYPHGLHQQPVFTETHGPTPLPVTELLTKNIISLPVHHDLADPEIESIIDAIRKISSSLKAPVEEEV